MTWLWTVLAFVGGAVIGVAFGHKARVVAYLEGHKSGYKIGLVHGWTDAEWNAAHPVEEEEKR